MFVWKHQPRIAHLSSFDGSHFALRKKRTFIGSDLANDVVLRFPSISLNHALIWWRFLLGYAVFDLDSTAGTFVNGVLIDGHQRIRAGDRIDFGTRSFIMKKEPSAALSQLHRRFIRIGAWPMALAVAFILGFAAITFLKGPDELAAERLNPQLALHAMTAAIRVATASQISLLSIGIPSSNSAVDSVGQTQDKWLMLALSDSNGQADLNLEPWKGKIVSMFRNLQACEKQAPTVDGVCVSEADQHWGKRAPNWLVVERSSRLFSGLGYSQPSPESLWDSKDSVELAAAFTDQDECRQWVLSQYSYDGADGCLALDDARWSQPFVYWKLLRPPALGGKSLALTEWETVSTARSRSECSARYSFNDAICIRSDDSRLAVKSSHAASSQ